jgi:hypothetical protein
MSKYQKLTGVAKDALENMAKSSKKTKLAPDERAVILDEIGHLRNMLKGASPSKAKTLKKQIKSLTADLKGLVEGSYE